MISRDIIIGIFAGVGSSTGWLIAANNKHKVHGHALYGIAGGVVGALAGACVSAVILPKKQGNQTLIEKTNPS